MPEQRKGQVLHLLTNAEAREQHMLEHLATITAPNVPGAVQNQTSPTELPVVKAASPPGQTLGMPSPLPPRTAPELYSPPPMNDDSCGPNKIHLLSSATASRNRAPSKPATPSVCTATISAIGITSTSNIRWRSYVSSSLTQRYTVST
ncbi:hypothetical protein N7G274_005069 [Stereocaulon virgatum]|uniref:Uncharacterized protein n=1 Tax=Stereocaulon virgatum TaxID=373712 RepID=A0ABR4ABL6_9LECA